MIFAIAYSVSLSVCFVILDIASAVNIGTVRLYRNGIGDTSQSWSSGIVQIYYSSQWGNICDDGSFGFDEADVICHQLGYIEASSYSNTENTTTWGFDSSPTVMDEVFCSTSSYRTITQCSFSTSAISSLCTNDRDITVTCHSTRIWHSPSSGDIRLTGGTYSNEGLLEVYCNGQWGTVCDDNFDSTEAQIACRQLGYNDYVNYDHLTLPATDPQQNIWLNTLTSCSSSFDTCLTSCGSCPASAITICTHSDDITLECRYHTTMSDVTTTVNTRCYDIALAPHGTIRLFRNGGPDTSQSWSSGIVQIYYSSQWGNICDDDDFGSDEADVICHQLGYTGASSYSNTGTNKTWGIDSLETNIDDVFCSTSSYLTITQCSFSTTISSSCTDNNDLTVTCYSTRIWDAPSTGDIRLTGSKYSNEGLLEIYCNGQWGTVCDDNFGSTEAQIACGQLGYNDYYNYNHLPSLKGLSTQNIWLWSLYGCSSSSDSCLTSCGACPRSQVTGCDHSEDVTLNCGYYWGYSKVSTETSISCAINETSNIYSNEITDSSDAALIALVISGFAVLVGCPIIVCVVCIVCVVKRRSKKRFQLNNAAPSTVSTIVMPLATEMKPLPIMQNNYISTTALLAPPFHELHGVRKDETAGVSKILLPSLIDKSSLRLIEKVGQGEFGVVYRGLLTVYIKNEPEVQPVAVKTFKGVEAHNTNELIVEAEKMIQFNHLNVLSLTGICVGLLESPCIVMPFMSNGSLLSYLRKESADLLVSESADENVLLDTTKHLLSMCLQVAKGMAYLAEQKFVHRDLAARNCMISADAIIKVADFGLAEDIYTKEYFKQERNSDGSVKLPLKWMALESIHYGKFSEKTDVWSYGILCWEVFSVGKSPYPGMSPKEVVEMLDSGERILKPKNPACSDEIYKFMISCWDYSPDKRPQFSDIVISVDKMLAPLADYLEFTDHFVRKLTRTVKAHETTTTT